MVFTNPWDESDPPGGQDANTADTEIQQVKVDVRERIESMLPGWADDLEDPKVFPGWIVNKTDVVSVGDNILDVVEWNLETRDTGGYFSSPDDDIIIPAGLGGLYIIGGTMGWETNSVNRREFTLRINTIQVDIDRREGIIGASTYNRISSVFEIDDADVIDTVVLQNSGIALDYGDVDGSPILVNFWGIRLAAF